MSATGSAAAQRQWSYPAPGPASPGMMPPPKGMMKPMGFMGPIGMPAGGTQSVPQGQDVNPYQQWLDAWQQMMNQQGGAAAR